MTENKKISKIETELKALSPIQKVLLDNRGSVSVFFKTGEELYLPDVVLASLLRTGRQAEHSPKLFFVNGEINTKILTKSKELI